VDVVVDQALFGYDRGHRLIASSTLIDKGSSRTLRAVTDLKVGAPSRSYLTVLPLPAMHRHAFIRTWAAGPGFRPGSVWSHVLLMRHEDLDQLGDFTAMQRLFAKPELVDDTNRTTLRGQYSTPLRFEPSGFTGEAQWPSNATRKLVEAAYATSEPAEVVLEPADVHDELLLSLLGQMWPELRRTFGFRTRYRRAGSTVATFALEVVERPSSRGLTNKVPPGEWTEALMRDLECPDLDLRGWLWQFGPAGPTERTAVPPLTNVLVAARSGNTTEVINQLRVAYPQHDEMESLKVELFGPSSLARKFALWPTAEDERLVLALRAAKVLDGDQLRMGERLTSLARSDAPRMVGLLREIDWNALDGDGRDTLVAALVDGLEPTALAEVATSRHELAPILLSRRPDAWQESEVWSDQFVAATARTLLEDATFEQRAATLLGLVATGQQGPAAELSGSDPSLWWTLLNVGNATELVRDKQALQAARVLLSRIGPKAIGSPPFGLSTPDQLEALARVTEPDNGLWKEAVSADWLVVLTRTRARWHDEPSEAFNIQVIALAAAESSRDLSAREATWTIVFGEMHRKLADSEAPRDAQRTLDRVLPGGPKWDWCGRLREGLARLAVDAKWDPGRIRSVAIGAGEFANDVARRVNDRADSKNEGFLEGLKNLFRL
jgi:hypothetical protein